MSKCFSLNELSLLGLRHNAKRQRGATAVGGLVQRVAAKRSGGFGTLNCLNAQCLLVAQLFIFALRPPFFLGAVSGSLFSVYMVITCPPILSVYLIF